MRWGLILVGMMLVIPAALGIGRSGNGTIVDPKSGATFGEPEFFPSAQPLSGDRLRLSSLFLEPAPMGFRQPFMEISSLGFSLSEQAGLGRGELALRMIELGWRKQTHTDPCVDAYLESSETTLVAAFAWGKGKGLVIVGPQSPNVRKALDSIRESLELQPGACAW